MAKKGGQPGNDNAIKGKVWSEAIKRAVARYGDGLPKGLDKLADKFVEVVAQGEGWAVKEFGDRIEGKVVQGIEGPGEDGEIITAIKVIYIGNSGGTPK